MKTQFDTRLGWILGRDSRSLNFLMKDLLPPIAYQKPKSNLWPCKLVLDQGQTPSCVGNGWTHWLACQPQVVKGLNEITAQNIYHLAQTLDQWPGTDYQGTSDLGGAKACQQMFPEHLTSYRWITAIDDMVATVGYFGPMVVAVNWYSSMYTPDKNGLVKIAGNKVGGHCFLVNEVNIEQSYFGCVNSWGAKWGVKGAFTIKFGGMDRLMKEQGEFCSGVKA